MPDFVHTIALTAANWLLIGFAAAVVIAPAWLLVATLRHRIQRYRFRQAACRAPLDERFLTDEQMEAGLRALLEEGAEQ